MKDLSELRTNKFEVWELLKLYKFTVRNLLELIIKMKQIAN